MNTGILPNNGSRCNSSMYHNNSSNNEQESPGITVRTPEVADAAAMHQLAITSGLDENSEYSYMMVCHYFGRTSAIASVSGGAPEQVAGFVSGFLVPESPSELFVWQIAVSPEHRGMGIAGKMLDSLVNRLRPHGLNYVQATINPSNKASISTFSSLAGRLNCEMSNKVAFRPDQFSGEGHEAEVLYRIGPVKAAPKNFKDSPGASGEQSKSKRKTTAKGGT